MIKSVRLYCVVYEKYYVTPGRPRENYRQPDVIGLK